MARYYHDGGDHKAATVKHPVFGEAVKVPPMFTGGKDQHVQYKPGSVCLSLVGHGFWVVPPGEFVELSHEVPPEAVKAAAPALLTEEEALAAGVAIKQPETVLAPKKEKAKAPTSSAVQSSKE